MADNLIRPESIRTYGIHCQVLSHCRLENHRSQEHKYIYDDEIFNYFGKKKHCVGL